jgi:uncharacterized protein with HEPN domain
LTPDSQPVESLLDILELIERIERQTRGLTSEGFHADPDIQDATAYRILAIGEASKDLGDERKARHPEVPWRQVQAMRNLLAHEYFVRESEIIWETVRVGLPGLANVCRVELERLGWANASR